MADGWDKLKNFKGTGAMTQEEADKLRGKSGPIAQSSPKPFERYLEKQRETDEKAKAGK